MSDKEEALQKEQELAAQEERDFLDTFSGKQVPGRAEDDDGQDDQGDDEQAPPDGSADPAPGDQWQDDQGESDDVLSRFEAENPDIVSRLTQRITADVEQVLSGRLRNIEGHIGGLKSRVQQITESRDGMAAAAKAAADKGGDAPSKQQIAEAVKSGEKLKALKEDFPEFAEAMEEMAEAIAGNIQAKTTTSIPDGEAVKTAEQLRDEAVVTRELIKLDRLAPGWEQKISSPTYANWLANQPADLQKLTTSTNAEDALKVLKKYDEFMASKNQSADKGRQNEQRLEGAVAPTDGKSVQRRQQPSEHDEFLAAFGRS